LRPRELSAMRRSFKKKGYKTPSSVIKSISLQGAKSVREWPLISFIRGARLWKAHVRKKKEKLKIGKEMYKRKWKKDDSWTVHACKVA
jgi:hypothetical protein